MPLNKYYTKLSNGILKIYVDGTEDTGDIKHRSDAMTSIYANTADLTVGHHEINGTATRFFEGFIDPPIERVAKQNAFLQH